MFCSLSGVIRILYIPLTCICFLQSEIEQGQVVLSDHILNSNSFKNDEVLSYSLDQLCDSLDNVFFNGITHLHSSLSPQYIKDSAWLNSSAYFVQFNTEIRNLLHGKLLVGSLKQLNLIRSVVLSFHDQDGNIMQDETDQLLQFTLIPRNRGYLFEVLRVRFDYTYAKLLFHFPSDINFDPNSIFFHFAYPSLTSSKSTSTTSSPRIRPDEKKEVVRDAIHCNFRLSSAAPKSAILLSEPALSAARLDFSLAVINGSNTVFIDFVEQIYSVSTPCPSDFFCFWMFDSTDMVATPNTSIGITFRPDQIGNRTISYIAIVNHTYTTLVSYLISVRPLFETAVLLYPNTSDIYGIWNTTAGGNSNLSTVGNGSGNNFFGEMPQNVFDRDSAHKYISFGSCAKNIQLPTMSCGLDTGFFVTLRPWPSLLLAFRFRTANDFPERDPFAVTIEGSNRNSSDLLSGSSWTLIYNGSSGLEVNPDRFQFGIIQNLSNNLLWFKSYRVLVTEKREPSDSVQYGDMELFGYYY